MSCTATETSAVQRASDACDGCKVTIGDVAGYSYDVGGAPTTICYVVKRRKSSPIHTTSALSASDTASDLSCTQATPLTSLILAIVLGAIITYRFVTRSRVKGHTTMLTTHDNDSTSGIDDASYTPSFASTTCGGIFLTKEVEDAIRVLHSGHVKLFLDTANLATREVEKRIAGAWLDWQGITYEYVDSKAALGDQQDVTTCVVLYAIFERAHIGNVADRLNALDLDPSDPLDFVEHVAIDPETSSDPAWLSWHEIETACVILGSDEIKRLVKDVHAGRLKIATRRKIGETIGKDRHDLDSRMWGALIGTLGAQAVYDLLCAEKYTSLAIILASALGSIEYGMGDHERLERASRDYLTVYRRDLCQLLERLGGVKQGA